MKKLVIVRIHTNGKNDLDIELLCKNIREEFENTDALPLFLFGNGIELIETGITIMK